MTKDEFTSQSKALSRILTLRILICLGLFFAALTAFALGATYSEKHYHASWTGGAFMVWLLVTSGAFLFSLFWQTKKLPGQFGLCCPDCGGSIDGKLILISGNCPNCGSKVLSDVSMTETKAGKSSRREFISALEALDRKEIRRQVVLLCVAFSAILGCIPLAKLLQSLVDKGVLDWAGSLPLGWIVGIFVGVLTLAVVSVLIYSASGKQKRIGIPCPHCQKPLFGTAARIAIATRACPYCGEAILD